MNLETIRHSLVDEIRSKGRPGGNEKLQAYLGVNCKVLGLSTPQLRDIVVRFVRSHKDMTSQELNLLAGAVWAGPSVEEKWSAISLLNRFSGLRDDESWRMVDEWVDQSVGWGLCDSLGSGPISGMVHDRPERFSELVKWAGRENFWRRRTALYALHDFVFAGELDRPFVLLEKLLYDEEFWVQRAVGTWLRECWKKDRQRTERFLLEHVKGMPKVVITVATERAPKSFRAKLRQMR